MSLQELIGAGTKKDLLGQPVLTAENVSITYEVDPPVHAVKNVSLTLKRGEILGLAGESGCGKTTLAFGMNQLLKPPAHFREGKVTFHDESGEDIIVSELVGEKLRRFRWDKSALGFQGALNSLNPVLTVRNQPHDVFTTHRTRMSKAER